jgi:hypothetical protein
MPRGNWGDDSSIPADAPLWRGIESDEMKDDPNTAGRKIPSLGPLITRELSVSIGSETTPTAVIAKGHAQGAVWRLWQFTAGDARAVGCIVDRDPTSDDPAHAVVLRADQPGVARIKDSSAKKLVLRGRWQDEAPAQTPPST